MVDYWLKYYFTNASYLRKNGEPVVFVFSPSRLNKNASGFGETGASLLKRARDKARQAGLPGIYFVGSVQANKGEIRDTRARSEEHTSELQSLMRISYAVFCLKKKKKNKQEQ